MIGSKLGPYQIREEVGRGGMATVYRAYQPTVDRDVAIKVITAAITARADAVQRFQREARLIARLEHPHILPVYDFDGGHAPPYIVMRYLDGGTLKAILKQGLLPPAEIAFLLGQIGAALDYAHRQGIIHRDVKPSNIMIDREGNAFVTDFGLARMVDVGGAGKQITKTGMVMGTPDYMSPEQALGESEIDHRADIYALGVIFYQMLTGELPFRAETAMAVLVQHMQAPVPAATARNPALPPAVDEIIVTALAKSPAERHTSIADFVAAATAALGQSPGGSPGQLRQAAADSIVLRRLAPDAAPKRDTQTPSEQNKTVTALSAGAADLSEIIEEERGPEAARAAVARLWQAAAEIVEERGGAVVSRGDDALLAVWGAETAREDDPEQAVRAALDIQAAVPSEAIPLQIGIHTGLALISPAGDSGSYSATGTTISLTHRLMQTAYESILITHNVYSQVRGIFDVQADAPLKLRRGRGTIPTYRVLAAKPRAFRLATRGVEGVETQMVGRAAELTALQNAFLDAVEESETQLITLTGEAGIGKSRLLYEFNNWAELRPERFFWLNGRATPEMSHRPYALLRDLLSFRFDILDSDSPATVRQKLESGLSEQIGSSEEMAHMLGHLAGFDLRDSPYIKNLLDDPQQLSGLARQMFKRWLAELCAAQTVVIQLEDIHHSDEPTLDLLNELVSDYDALPLLLIAVARPALFERRPAWGSGLAFHTRLNLHPLDRRESRGLAREILQKVDPIPKPLRDLLVERAEGNPYYLEELVKHLIDDRVIIKESNDRWRVEMDRLGHVQVPPTLTGLLQARLDSLLYPEKLTLQRAAVIGRIFHDSALAALDAGDETHLDDLPGILARLAGREFIYPRETSAFEGSREYIFGDQMLREVLLTTLLRRQQEIYNRAAADWLAQIGGERVAEYAARIAEHYEQGEDYEQAAQYLQQAGERALTISAFGEARAHFERALSLLERSDRFDNPVNFALLLRLKLGEALYELSEYSTATEILEVVLATARRQNDTKHIVDALFWLGRVGMDTGSYSKAQNYIEEGLSQAQMAHNETMQIPILLSLSWLHITSGKYEAAGIAGKDALSLSRQNEDAKGEMHALKVLGAIALFQGNLDKAAQFSKEFLLHAQQMGNRQEVVAALNIMGVLAQKRSDYTQALSHYERAIPLAREIDSPTALSNTLTNLTEGYIWLNDYTSARRSLHESLTLARKIEAIPVVLFAVHLAGWLFARQGQTERGVALFGLALHHPATTAEIGEYVQTELADLGLDPEDPAIAAQLEAGVELDLDEVVEELLAELKGD